MHQILFYEKADGTSDVWDFLEELRKRKDSAKDARIQYRQVMFSIELLSQSGTRLPSTVVKHLEDDIWELRPGRNRVLFFYYDGNGFVLLHHFLKKTQKTPRKEIEKAKAERKDFLRREGSHENLE